ncbi:indolepyruvate ferredoxin oxidoreductase [Candidatus Bealeia paramacronuclearis]|uniref:Indolepyruvate ferredoxin oxidoreductase n=2 Tax=Candidatus Bealeia paramacronuclearis TaxID=1921001 RepID=A0ABZ2C214_9PROT|nr:indolepyruvate ferredoxin oxidoreductase [Candidatus Bealeia paramacronuclearis]
MATWIAHNTATFTQMGGEGVTWVGQAPFTDERHIFANLGDGTYFHSGLLAIRAAFSAKVNITYKILYNDAVAMTGGQHVDGELTVPMITQQLYAEGVRKIVIATDEPHKYPLGAGFAPGVKIHHRDELDVLQDDLKKWPGVSVLIYDQTCAAEKRRRRKRGLMEDPQKRIFINERVCEGCGDCSVKSNCVSVQPIETPLGRKRTIDQSSCNKDFSCVNGFCPSFVTVEGARPRKAKASTGKTAHLENLPDPILPTLNAPFSIYLTGVGGTGVVTIGALLGMAAHLEKKGCSIVDMAGLAQKGGAVVSHIRIAQKPSDIQATRVSRERADLILGCDIVVAAGPDALATIKTGHTQAIINENQTITGHFIHSPDYDFKHEKLRQNLLEKLGAEHTDFIDATHLATRILGDAIATNLFILGYAYQKGLIPIHHEAILKAVELNAVAVEFNKLAFHWGRYAVLDFKAVEDAANLEFEKKAKEIPQSLEAVINHRKQHLTGYQNKAYAERYELFVRKIEAQDQKLGRQELSLAVAKYYAKLLAYKDEYEVARLYTDGTYLKELYDQFEGNLKMKFHLAPPLLSYKDPKTGQLKKSTYGPWIFSVFKILAKLKGLRGTALDIFGYTHERKTERSLIGGYENLVYSLLPHLSLHNYDVAVELATLPEHIRGFGHVKECNFTSYAVCSKRVGI